MEFPGCVNHLDGHDRLHVSDDGVEFRRASAALSSADFHGRQRTAAVLAGTVPLTDWQRSRANDSGDLSVQELGL